MSFASTLFGVWGAVFLLLGLLVPLLLPLVPATTGRAHALSQLHLWLAMKLHGRMAWVVDSKDRLIPRRLHREPETGNEYVKLDGERLTFEDPDLSISKWKNVDMTLADGKYGVLFDPRHAAVGGRILDLRERDEAVIPASSPQATQQAGIGQWVRGVLSFPDGKYELPRLAWVRALFGGRERASDPAVLQEFYRKSREPYQDDGSEWARLLVVIGAMILPALSMWLVGDYIGSGGAAGGGGGGGGGNGTDTELGVVALASLGSLAALREYPWRAWARRALAILVPVLAWTLTIGSILGMHYVTASAYGVGTMLAVDVAFVAGLLLFGLLLLVSAAVGIIGGGVGSVLMKLGLLAYRKPVWVWTREGYELHDWARVAEDKRAGHADPVWYRAYGADVGFSFAASPDSWGEHIELAELGAMTGPEPAEIEVENPSAATADGGAFGDIADDNLPAGWAGVPELRRGGGYGGYIPREPDHDQYYIHSGVALNRLWDASTGRKSQAALLAAKNEYGGDDSLGEGAWLMVTAALALVSFAGGAWLFVM